MKVAALAILSLMSLFICIALVAFTAQKIADEAPAAIGQMVGQAQIAYQKAHDDAVKGK